MKIKTIEFYLGIGIHHQVLKEYPDIYEPILAFDKDQESLDVFRMNHPDFRVVKSTTLDEVRKLPPCDLLLSFINYRHRTYDDCVEILTYIEEHSPTLILFEIYNYRFQAQSMRLKKFLNHVGYWVDDVQLNLHEVTDIPFDKYRRFFFCVKHDLGSIFNLNIPRYEGPHQPVDKYFDYTCPTSRIGPYNDFIRGAQDKTNEKLWYRYIKNESVDKSDTIIPRVTNIITHVERLPKYFRDDIMYDISIPVLKELNGIPKNYRLIGKDVYTLMSNSSSMHMLRLIFNDINKLLPLIF